MARSMHNLESAGSFTKAVAVVPNDTADLPWTARGIYVGGIGDVAVILANDDDASPVTLKAPQLGVCHRIAVKRVMATNTTATLIIALA